MGRRIGHDRAVTLVVEVALATAVAAAAAVGVDCIADPRWDPGLAVAVFGTFLTSMAIIAAFSIEEKSRWPTPWEMLDRAHVLGWFVVALASVAAALLATVIDDDFLNAFGLTLALVGLAMGAWALRGLFSLSSDRGRRKLVVELLADSIRRSELAPGSDDVDLGEVDTEDHVPAWFLSAGTPPEAPSNSGVLIGQVPNVLRLYADRRDPDAIIRLVDEVHAAATLALSEDDWGGREAYLARIDTLLRVQRGMFEELAGRVLSGQLGEAAASGALTRAGEAALDVAGRVRKPPPSCVGVGREAEVLAARHLTALCRVAGSAAAAADAALGTGAGGSAAGGSGWARLTALREAGVKLQQAARWAIDPAPPGMKLPEGHPWRTGLSTAEGALVWLWSAAESPSGPYGVGLYAVCEILTGEKFLDSYWEGYDVFTEVERRLSGGHDSHTVRGSRATLERAGGLARASLELAAARLAVTPPRGSGVATGAGEPDDDRHVAWNLFLAGGGYKPAGRDPIDDLAWLLTDRLSGSLWTMVHDQLGRLGEKIVRPPLRPLYLDPAACALAISLRLTPMERDAGPEGRRPLTQLVESLPRPLLDRTAALARSLTGIDGEGNALNREGDEDALIAAAGFVRELIPESLPRPAAPAPVGAAPPAPVASAVAGPPAPPAARRAGPEAFERALGRIAAAESAIEVDLIQCDRRWLEEWADLRSALDAALLAAALRGRARIRRVILFEIPGDAKLRMTRFHYRWTDALSTAVGCFEPQPGDTAGEPSRYRVRQLVLPFADADARPPADCVVLRGAGDPDPAASGAFESTWALIDHGARDPAREAGLTNLAGRAGPLEPL
jgi:hypothetical protein